MDILRRKTSVHHFDDAPKVRDDFPEWYLLGKKKLRKKGLCFICGGVKQNKRMVVCEDNTDAWDNCYYKWQMISPTGLFSSQVTSLRKTMHRNNGFKCNNNSCDVIFKELLPSGLEVPKYLGEVDHKVALVNGGEDIYQNLQLLCCGCHKKKTKLDMKQRDLNKTKHGFKNIIISNT